MRQHTVLHSSLSGGHDDVCMAGCISGAQQRKTERGSQGVVLKRLEIKYRRPDQQLSWLNQQGDQQKRSRLICLADLSAPTNAKESFPEAEYSYRDALKNSPWLWHSWRRISRTWDHACVSAKWCFLNSLSACLCLEVNLMQSCLSSQFKKLGRCQRIGRS